MKNLFLMLFLSSALSLNAQIADTTYLSRRIDKIDLALEKSHERFRSGTILMVGGLFVNGLTYFMKKDDLSSSVSLIGFAALSAGAIIQIDSHKFLGRVRGRRSYY